MAARLEEVGLEGNRNKSNWLWLALAVLVVSLSHYLTPLEFSEYHDILRRLYYLPIFFGAALGGKRGGLAIAAFSALFYAPHIMFQWESHNLAHASHEGHLNKYIEVAVFFLFGHLSGAVFDRLSRATEDLKHSIEAGRISSKLTALGQLSAGLAHEIRNPLAGIRSSLDVIEGECEGSEKESIQEFLGLARREIDRADRLIREFLDFAKPRAPDQVRVKITELVESIQPLVSPEAQKAGVKVEIRCSSELGDLVGDLDQLKQVLLNLTLNAIQSASSSKGLVAIQASMTEAGLIQIEISDNGMGVEEEYVDRIFDPFFTTRDQGVGLGLSISYQIVQQHKGTLGLLPRGKLGGATFVVNLPKNLSPAKAL